MTAVAYRNTEAGARRFVQDEGIDLKRRHRRERLIEQARRWNEAHAVPTSAPPPTPVAIVKETDEARALSIMRESGVPEWIREIVLDVAKAIGVSPLDVVGTIKRPLAVSARGEVWYKIRERDPARYSWKMIADWFGKDHKSIIYGVSRYAFETGKPPLTKSDAIAHRASVREWQRARRSKTDEPRLSIQHGEQK